MQLAHLLKEIYQEEDSTFTHNDVEYDLNLLLRLSKDVLVFEYPVKKLKWILKHDTPSEDRVKKAKLKYPILITKSQKRWVTLDGLHRLAKAVGEGDDKIKVKVILPSILEKCKL
jgi:hypothetical protein